MKWLKNAFDILTQVEDKTCPLSSMTDEVVNAKTLVKDVTEDKVTCIRRLTECKPLITWLQDNIDGKCASNIYIIMAELYNNDTLFKGQFLLCVL